MQQLRATMRVNLSMGLVFVSLVAELLFILLLGYGLYRVIEVFR